MRQVLIFHGVCSYSISLEKALTGFKKPSSLHYHTFQYYNEVLNFLFKIELQMNFTCLVCNAFGCKKGKAFLS